MQVEMARTSARVARPGSRRARLAGDDPFGTQGVVVETNATDLAAEAFAVPSAERRCSAPVHAGGRKLPVGSRHVVAGFEDRTARVGAGHQTLGEIVDVLPVADRRAVQ